MDDEKILKQVQEDDPLNTFPNERMTNELLNQFTYPNRQHLDFHRAISPVLSLLFR